MVREYTAADRYRWHCDNAKRRNLVNELSLEDYTAFRNQECYICYKPGECGVDREDNQLGYIKSNCKPCCGRCNKMKGEMSLKEFVNAICEMWNGIQYGERRYWP